MSTHCAPPIFSSILDCIATPGVNHALGKTTKQLHHVYQSAQIQVGEPSTALEPFVTFYLPPISEVLKMQNVYSYKAVQRLMSINSVFFCKKDDLVSKT